MQDVVRTSGDIPAPKCRGYALMSGGLDSQLAVRILQRAGASVEAICFSTPFFDCRAAKRAAEALDVVLHIVDFTADEIALIENPPHGFGGAMNPCIDCHATMIRRAGEMMVANGFDFVATGEVMGQRPMSQNKQSLGVVEKSSGLKGRLVRPLSAQLLEPTLPETEGLLDRSRLLNLSGRARDRQIALAQEFGIVEYPSPAGGCKLTEAGFGRRLRDLQRHEGLRSRRLVELLLVARRFRLPGGTSVILGRDQTENAILKRFASDETIDGFENALVLAPVNVPGPTAFVPDPKSAADVECVRQLVCAYSRYDQLEGNIILSVGGVYAGDAVTQEVARPYDRAPFKEYQIC